MMNNGLQIWLSKKSFFRIAGLYRWFVASATFVLFWRQQHRIYSTVRQDSNVYITRGMASEDYEVNESRLRFLHEKWCKNIVNLPSTMLSISSRKSSSIEWMKIQKAFRNRCEETAYNQFLMPYYDRNPHMKMLEIGSSCNDSLDTSVAFWRNLLPEVKLSVAVHNSKCFKEPKDGGGVPFNDVKILSGNQVLDKFTGAVVIDTGGQGQCQSVTSFEKLWPHIMPGGLYIIENMSSSLNPSCKKDKKELLEKLMQKLDDTVHEVEDDAKFFLCQRNVCVVGKNGPTLTNFGEADFVNTAKMFRPITDKVRKHRYQIMYGQFLLPYSAMKPHTKMLEIGLGCDMKYGPGASVSLYRKLFPDMDKWEAEYNGGCVKISKERGELDGFNVLVGDQGDIPTLDKWIEESGGANFDVVIDDGGHKQCQIWTTFQKLWPRLLSGGLYFIEDLEVSRWGFYKANHPTALCPVGTNVPDKMKEMIGSLVHQRNETDIDFIFCQRDACMLKKK